MFGLELKAFAVFAIIIGGLLLLFPLEPKRLPVLALEPKRLLLVLPLDPKTLLLLLLDVSLLLLFGLVANVALDFPPAPKLPPGFALELFPIEPVPLFAEEPAPNFLLIGATVTIYNVNKM